MANALHTSAKKLFLDADIDLLVATSKIILGDAADDTPVPATDDYLDDILAAARVATATLSTPTTTAGTFDTADPTFSAVTGDVSEWILLYVDTAGAESTDPLVAYYDTFSSGMPVTPNGGNINVTVNASGWFSL